VKNEMENVHKLLKKEIDLKNTLEKKLNEDKINALKNAKEIYLNDLREKELQNQNNLNKVKNEMKTEMETEIENMNKLLRKEKNRNKENTERMKEIKEELTDASIISISSFKSRSASVIWMLFILLCIFVKIFAVKNQCSIECQLLGPWAY
jgi:uncharacterized integral membrane protein